MHFGTPLIIANKNILPSRQFLATVVNKSNLENNTENRSSTKVFYKIITTTHSPLLSLTEKAVKARMHIITLQVTHDTQDVVINNSEKAKKQEEAIKQP